ncbi:MAG: BamA/TamA family outer membrane protein [Balneolaceae bacterium]
MKSLLSILLLSTLIFLPNTGFSQLVNEESDSDVNYSFVPVFAYTSDSGLIGGILLQRIDYRNDRNPFFSNTKLDINGSTKGRWVAALDHERLQLLGTDIRNHTIIEYERNPRSTFFGLGNDTSFSKDEYEEGLYYLVRNFGLLSFSARKQLLEYSEYGNLDGLVRFKGSYTVTSDRGNDTRFVNDRPIGFDGGWVNKIGFGFVADSRDSEFSPSQGGRFEIGFNTSGNLTGSDYSFTDYFADFRIYTPVFWDVIIAQRLEVKHSMGDVPFWELPIIGNQRGLRGYAQDRFRGDSSVLHMIEVRRWLFSFFEDDIRIGGHLFTDTGRVFSDFDSSALFGNLKNTWGFGATMSVLSPDLIVRGELGFSNEDYRIYAGLGYAF